MKEKEVSKFVKKKKHVTKREFVVKQRGITLIALVITIIVLLILAGVTIATLTGENGILTRASEATEETRVGQVEEQVELWKSEKEMGKQTGGEVTSEDDFLQSLKDNGSVTEDEIDRMSQVIRIGDTEIYYGSGPELTDVYVALYTDGTLVFNNKDEFDEGLISKEYGNIRETGGWGIPWSGDSGSIKTVNFINEIVPISTARWFSYCSNLTNIKNIKNLNTSRVIDMNNMFNMCGNLTELDVTGFNTSNVTNMSAMFFSCSKLTHLNVTGFDTSNVINMSNMFGNCQFSELDVTSFNTSKVTSMYSMFASCSNLTGIDVSGFDTSNVTNMGYMFSYCQRLTGLDLSNFNTEKVTTYNSMLNNVTAQVYIGPNWKSEMTASATNYAGEFLTK